MKCATCNENVNVTECYICGMPLTRPEDIVAHGSVWKLVDNGPIKDEWAECPDCYASSVQSSSQDAAGRFYFEQN